VYCFAQIAEANKRVLCAYKVANDTKDPSKWWDYAIK
jgi:hypothetical protein